MKVAKDWERFPIAMLARDSFLLSSVESIFQSPASHSQQAIVDVIRNAQKYTFFWLWID